MTSRWCWRGRGSGTLVIPSERLSPIVFSFSLEQRRLDLGRTMPDEFV